MNPGVSVDSAGRDIWPAARLMIDFKYRQGRGLCAGVCARSLLRESVPDHSPFQVQVEGAAHPSPVEGGVGVLLHHEGPPMPSPLARPSAYTHRHCLNLTKTSS
jgi:hypothetical protein